MIVFLAGMGGVELGQLSKDGAPEKEREKGKEEVRTKLMCVHVLC